MESPHGREPHRFFQKTLSTQEERRTVSVVALISYLSLSWFNVGVDLDLFDTYAKQHYHGPATGSNGTNLSGTRIHRAQAKRNQIEFELVLTAYSLSLFTNFGRVEFIKQ